MRIILASLASAAAVALAGPCVPLASAHFCAYPVELRVGEQAVVNIGVAAEDKAVVRVDVTVPRNFQLEEPIGYLGWIGTVNGNVAQFEGAVMQPYTCAFFALRGEATTKGRLVATIRTHAADGTTVRYASTKPFDPFAAQLIYAGIPIPEQGVTPGSGSGSSGFGLALAGSIILGALVVGAAVLVNRRRGAPDRA